ncbi:MAG TPA: hypothetical protein VJ044_13130, partial [Candidatus Hodarchaeales archaeon]|nr:hypothetical protein [Candidatus Hodarchaeales archaeon]
RTDDFCSNKVGTSSHLTILIHEISLSICDCYEILFLARFVFLGRENVRNRTFFHVSSFWPLGGMSCTRGLIE